MQVSGGRVAGPTRVRLGMKRALDIVTCLVALPLIVPIMVAVAVVLVLVQEEVVYRARRVGRYGAIFTMFKFATMRPGAGGPRVTRQCDPRITPIGRWLRATKLNELPQVLNVLRGEMSIVGPRPEDPRYAAFYTPQQRMVFTVRPGMTCLAYLAFGDEEAFIERAAPADVEEFYVRDVLPGKLDVELEYVRSWSVRGDLRIIGCTLGRLLRRG